MQILPRNVICVLGRWRDFAVLREAVASCGEDFTFDAEYSSLAHDDRMPVAFDAASDPFDPSLTEEDLENIRSHTVVAYILSSPIPQTESEEIAARTLLLIATLLELGAVAAKSESAGLAHGRARWLEFARKFREAKTRGDIHSARAVLFRAWVQRLIHDESAATYYSTGMHLLGHRDLEIDDSLDPQAALEWIDLLGLYLVADQPNRPLLDGEGFRLQNDGPRRIFRLSSCGRYEIDDFFSIRTAISGSPRRKPHRATHNR